MNTKKSFGFGEETNGMIMEITPELAKTWLKDNVNNRNLNIAEVKRLARAMRTGNWKVNGDAIRWGKLGTLLDGQHRLHACIEANLPFKSLVLFGIDEDAFPTIDQGRKRTSSDVLGTYGVRYASSIASAVRMIYRYLEGSISVTDSRTTRRYGLTNNEVAQIAVERTQGIQSRAAECLSTSHGLLSGGHLLAFYWMACHADEEKAKEFLRLFKTGAGMEEGHPVLTLRNRLAIRKQQIAKENMNVVFAWVVKSWNAFCLNRTIHRLTFRHMDNFPRMHGFDEVTWSGRILLEPNEQNPQRAYD